jgi:site-specific recombinase XerD
MTTMNISDPPAIATSANVGDFDHLATWLAHISPEKTGGPAGLERLLELMLTPARRRLLKELARPLAEHLPEFEKNLRTSAGEKHVRSSMRQVRRMLQLSGAKFWHDLTQGSIRLALSLLRATAADSASGRGHKPKMVGPATCNAHFHSIKHFCSWLINEGRAEQPSPCAGIRPLNVQEDLRRRRRSLTEDEIDRLIAATMRSPAVAGIGGVERAIGYVALLWTGARKSELASFRKSDFHFTGENAPFITIPGDRTKNGDVAKFPLRADVATELRRYLDTVPREDHLFRFPTNNRALKKDLAAAGIKERNSQGEWVDHHSLRHTLGSRVHASGATLKELQQIMRHSSAAFTIQTYVHTSFDNLRSVMEKLPAISVPDAPVARAEEPPELSPLDDLRARFMAELRAENRMSAHQLKTIDSQCGRMIALLPGRTLRDFTRESVAGAIAHLLDKEKLSPDTAHQHLKHTKRFAAWLGRAVGHRTKIATLKTRRQRDKRRRDLGPLGRLLQQWQEHMYAENRVTHKRARNLKYAARWILDFAPTGQIEELDLALVHRARAAMLANGTSAEMIRDSLIGIGRFAGWLAEQTGIRSDVVGLKSNWGSADDCGKERGYACQ